MIYTPLTKKAMCLCFEQHQHQRDKSGIPYVFHPFHVAESMPDEITTCVALLHDIVEDTPVTIAELEQMGFPPAVTEAVALLTHLPEIPYEDYIRSIRKNPIAVTVKLADLNHNSDLSRCNSITEKDRERVKKYQRARELLTSEE